jgi:ferric-dicitrate binding protein FerR (iron transport regulator)
VSHLLEEQKMNNNQNIPEEIKEDIINLLSNKISAEESTRLLAWLKVSEENKIFFDQITDIWHTSSSMSKAEEFDAQIAWNDISKILQDKPASEKLKALHWLKPFAAAAAILIIAFLSALLIMQKSGNIQGPEQYVEMIAPLGSRSIVMLPDGTKVWLNSGSKITFSNAFGKSSRDLKLEGEAYFAVAKNKEIPFVVHTSAINITALGTAFNVKAYDDDDIIETTLEEGSVKIESVTKTGKVSVPLILKPKQKAVFNKTGVTQTASKPVQETLKPAEKTVVQTKSELLQVDSVADTKPYTSWKDSRWIFRHEKLEDLVRKLERRYDVEISFKDNSLKTYSFSGSLYDESIEQVFEAIKMIAPIEYKIDHKKIEISTNEAMIRKYENLRK